MGDVDQYMNESLVERYDIFCRFYGHMGVVMRVGPGSIGKGIVEAHKGYQLGFS